MAEQLENMNVAVLLTNGFEEVEMTEPRQALQDAGANVFLVSPQRGTIEAWDVDDWGEDYDVDVVLDDAKADDYAALLLPGGVLNPDNLRVNDDAVAFVKSFFDAGKPVAAICHGPWTLIEADVVRGRRMTSYKSIKTDLKNAGADWVDEAPVTDGNLVTARNPDDIPAFNEAIVAHFAKARSGETVTG